MKISIIGAGAMGSLFGGKLSAAGNDVVLYDINKAHVEAVNKDGLKIETLATGEIEVVTPKASSDANEVNGSDIMIVFVKSTATGIIADNFKKAATDSTIVVTLQNGYGNEEILKNSFGASHTAAGVTSQGATFAGPGHIKHAGNGPTHICMSDKNNDKLKPFIQALNKAGFEADIETNIESLVWSKLVINVGINALTALSGLKNGELLDYAEMKALMKDLVDEAVAVCEKTGIKLTYDNPLEVVYSVAEKTGPNRSSMLQDFDRGSMTEIDFINNAIVRAADEAGIDVPVNRTITRLVKTIDLSRK
ncbi:MAG: 2-dehydropantoate 2-reductase [Spirochaetales bacterium]|uniref:2-dehydropantoate 2-reductase n=1 Tax=Candidatus Thalassospirochaeta sargassi TaxID=3119039 RepID=A0AAJ1MKR8_9SPIO|nr:2-dehydropantoate 2-reductase [Spirochaetales bacterium]